jgi:flagellar assembly factor FliW
MSTVETWFGQFAATPENIITMAEPLPGFEACRRYALVGAPEIAPFMCVQGLDEPRPSFLAIDPRVVRPDYSAALPDGARSRLVASAEEPLLLLALVRISADGRATANLRAPLVINPSLMTALQHITDDDYAVDWPLD